MCGTSASSAPRVIISSTPSSRARPISSSVNVRQRRFGSIAEQEHDVAVEPVGTRVVEGGLGPVDPPRDRRPRARRAAGWPGSRRSPPGRGRRTALPPRSWQGSRRRARRPARRRSSRGRRRSAPGASSCGRRWMRSSSGHRSSLRAPATNERPAGGRHRTVTNATTSAQTAAAKPTCASTSGQGRCVRYWISPIAICTSSAPSTTRREGEQARRALAPRGQVAEHEHEADREDRHRRRVDVDQAAAGARAGGPGWRRRRSAGRRGRQRSADEQGECGARDHERGSPQLQRDERLRGAVWRCGRPRARARRLRRARAPRAAGARRRSASVGRS